MEALTQTVPNQAPIDTQSKPVAKQPPVVLRGGVSGVRFGPVVTGQVALGKDGCGY